MAWNIRTSRVVTPSLEIFRKPPNAQGFDSIVIDATAITAVSGVRKLVAGTPLTKDGVTNQFKRMTVGTETCAGILAHDVEVPDGTSSSDLPAALAFHGEVFRADRIVDYGTLGTDIKADLPTCLFS